MNTEQIDRVERWLTQGQQVLAAVQQEQQALSRQVGQLREHTGGPAAKVPQRVGILTAGGLAPCLASAIGALVERYTELYPQASLVAYRNGYQGLLLGDSVPLNKDVRRQAGVLHTAGGSPIGNSRVKLTNAKDCVKRGLVKEGEDPRAVAAAQLVKDGIEVLHTIGGDDTNIAAADLAVYLERNNYSLTVIGLPKTIDNDIYPIKQSLGAWTAAQEGAQFFMNVVGEYTASPHMLIVHEVMGRECGYLTAATAHAYRKLLAKQTSVPGFGASRQAMDIHAIYIPEIPIDIEAEAWRLKKIMDSVGNVNIFISEGAGVKDIVQEMKARGQEVPCDAFGHVKLDKVNPGAWFAQHFSGMIGAQKTLTQKSGYYSRAAPPNAEDRRLIQACVALAVDCAVRREGGVIGHDEDNGDLLRAVEFSRIRGGKPFDTTASWFLRMHTEIAQCGAQPARAAPEPLSPVRPAPCVLPGYKCVAVLTSGGLAPGVASIIAALVERYHERYPATEVVCYRDGYRGLLRGDSFRLSREEKASAALLHLFRGSPLGSSRVRLTNVANCERQGLIKPGEDPLAVAAQQLRRDGVDILHPIGGADDLTAARDLAAFLEAHHEALGPRTVAVVGVPSAIDNNCAPVRQCPGAWTAAEAGAAFFMNVVNERTANPRMLIVHEVMGHRCGYLNAATVQTYRARLAQRQFLPGIGLTQEAMDVHAVFIPEMPVDINGEAVRLKKIMDRLGCVNIFISEGAGVPDILKEMDTRGREVPTDPFGHVKLDKVNPGEWFGLQFAAMLQAEKTLIQKSGYHSRAVPANAADLRLIYSLTSLAVECAMHGESGVVGHDEDQGGLLRLIEFSRIKGGKPFDTGENWFTQLRADIRQGSHLPSHRMADRGRPEDVWVVQTTDIYPTSPPLGPGPGEFHKGTA